MENWWKKVLNPSYTDLVTEERIILTDDTQVSF